jgi:hypothetical protein
MRTYKTRVKVRTKCDYPLKVGDKFGVLEVVGYIGSDGLSCAEGTEGSSDVQKHIDVTDTLTQGPTRRLSDGALAGLITLVGAVCLLGVLAVGYRATQSSTDLKASHVVLPKMSEAGDSDVYDYKWDDESLISSVAPTRMQQNLDTRMVNESAWPS